MFLDIPGEEISPESLAVSKAQELANYLLSGANPYATLCRIVRQADSTEFLIMDLAIQVGQKPVHPIHRSERVATGFKPEDAYYPDVLSLRPDFPLVPHRAARATEFPRGLCLYEEPYAEVKLHWSAPAFIERIRVWMRDTARGVLHREDQPLEPILFATGHQVILQTDLFSQPQAAPEKLFVFPVADQERTFIVKRFERITDDEKKRAVAFVGMGLCCPPQTHGVIRYVPTTLKQLHDIVATTGENLLARIRENLGAWTPQDAPRTARLLLIINFLKTRTAGEAPELAVSDVWAFMTEATIGELGAALSIWAAPNGRSDGQTFGTLIGVPFDEKQAEAVPVWTLNVHFALSRLRAALYNATLPDDRQIVVIGVGALGSQVVPKLIRSGFGRWVLVDNDVLLPHNVARHDLTQDCVGFDKAPAGYVHWNRILETPAVTDAIVADVLQPGTSAEQLQKAFSEAAVIADFSASIPVARHLACDVDTKARRLSAFISPSGQDGVLLAEDQERRQRLDVLEMQYYREVLRRPELAKHLLREDTGRIRYARSCRDLTSTIPEDLVGLHSSIASRALREAASAPDATIRIWTTDADFAVHSFRIEASPPVELLFGSWRLYTDAALQQHLEELRRGRLPNETGGVLLGSFDRQRRIVYVIDSIPSPPDSREWPTEYIRGCEGLEEAVLAASTRTDGMLQYVGEWHSHPDGYSSRPSHDDRDAFAFLTERMKNDGLPALMSIVGQTGASWFLGEMPA